MFPNQSYSSFTYKTKYYYWKPVCVGSETPVIIVFFFNKLFHHNFQEISQVRLFEWFPKELFFDIFSIILSSCFLPAKVNRKKTLFFSRDSLPVLVKFSRTYELNWRLSSCVLSHELSSKLCWRTVFCVHLFYYIKLYNYCKLINCKRNCCLKNIYQKNWSERW